MVKTSSNPASSKVVPMRSDAKDRQRAATTDSDSARANKFARKTEKLGKARGDVDSIGYAVSSSVTGFVELFGQLLSVTDTHVVFRHKRARGTKVVVSHFDKNDVALIQGGLGEPSRILVNTLHTIFEVKAGARVRYLKNGFSEITEPTGDKTFVNVSSNTGLINNSIQGDEENVVAKSSAATTTTTTRRTA